MNICVTGGAGYIGSVLTERLLNLGHQVTVVDTFLHGCHGIMRLASHPLLTVVERDIRHEDRDYLDKQDVVFHLAAISNIGACERDRELAWEVNRNATVEISKRLHRDALLVFASSTAMYGDRFGGVVPDGLVLRSTKGVYSNTKLSAEYLIKYRDNAIVLRLATVYGVSPLMRHNTIINDFVRMAVQDKRIVLYDNLTVRPYLHIETCINRLVDHTSENSGTFNLAGNHHSKQDIVDVIREHIEFEVFLSSTRNKFVQDFRLNVAGIVESPSVRGLRHAIRDLIKLYSFYNP